MRESYEEYDGGIYCIQAGCNPEAEDRTPPLMKVPENRNSKETGQALPEIRM